MINVCVTYIRVTFFFSQSETRRVVCCSSWCLCLWVIGWVDWKPSIFVSIMIMVDYYQKIVVAHRFFFWVSVRVVSTELHSKQSKMGGTSSSEKSAEEGVIKRPITFRRPSRTLPILPLLKILLLGNQGGKIYTALSRDAYVVLEGWRIKD